MRSRRISLLAAVGLVASLMVAAGAQAQPATPDGPPADDTRDTAPDYNDGKTLPLREGAVQPQARQRSFGTQSTGPQVGDTKFWLGLDDAVGVIYPKPYELRGIGENVEVWVASGLADPTPGSPNDESQGVDFLPDDCRNGERTTVTDAQVDHFIDEFDTNIYPKESEAFSTPPDRDGSDATFDDALNLPSDYYQGDGDDIVVLVDNVRDANFYHELSGPDDDFPPYIAGFFFSVFNEGFDRNVMTIDAFDWLHRTTANPPDDPSDDPCTSAPARPFLYEGTFAHEYQHLLEYYEDPDETTWVNEGLSDWAQTLTGYVDPSVPITETGYDSHVQCLYGNLGIETAANPNPTEAGGPENSLNVWQDQGFSEILCDYGAAYTIMEQLHGRYGTDFMSELHRDDAGGFEGLQNQLDAFATGTDVRSLLHDWSAMLALDGVLDDNRGKLRGGDAADHRVPTLDAGINWDDPDAYSTPGAPPNGSDYVRLRDASGDYLAFDEIDSLAFDGAESLPPHPVAWTVAGDPDPQTGAADAALYSGAGNNLDRAIIEEVTVPEDPAVATLSFDTWFNIEWGWDYGFVQVSTDGGQTWESLGNEDTTDVTASGAIGTVRDNVPGFTGVSSAGGAVNGADPAWMTTEFALDEYAGQTVHLAFRYVTDPAIQGNGAEGPAGLFVDDVTVGGNPVSDGSDLGEWQSATQLAPTPVAGFTVQLVGYNQDGRGPANLMQVPLDEAFDGSLGTGQLRSGMAGADVVGAIVTYDEPTASVSDYAPYTLTVNGVTQPGG